jgi:threonine dehydratase
MVTLKQIEQAAERIRKEVIRTPLIFSPSISRMFGARIYLKLENLQKTGSFKIRGASYKLMKMAENTQRNEVVAASAGNHAQGVALAARQAGFKATIVMPVWASITKQEATRAYGGQVVIHGSNLSESLKKAQEISNTGSQFVHPFDDQDIIAGQGTVALEIFEDLEDPDIIIAPIGGGGFMSGIATVAKTLRPQTKVIGVQAAACPSARKSLEIGQITKVKGRPSIADGISVKQIGEITFGILREFVDEVVLVEEEHIAAAILMLLELKKVLAEGSGAVSLAALLSGSIIAPPDHKIVLVISGGNLDSPLLGRIIGQGLIKRGRIIRVRVSLSDTPGSLALLLSRVADLKANVLHIYHDRNVKDLPIYVTRVDLELETRSNDHVDEIVSELGKLGYEIKLL